jgi:RTC4-like domain
MSCVLQLLFDDTMDNNGVSVINFIRRVLLPEAAVLLAQEDMGLTRQDAIDIIRTSRLWGLTMHPDDDTNHGGEYYMDIQKRREQKAKQVKQENMDVDPPVQVPTVDKEPTGNTIIPTTSSTSAPITSTSSTVLAPTDPTVAGSKSSVPKGLKEELVDIDLTAANSEIGDVVYRTIVDENGDEIIEID